jgi:peptidoglycan/LPS O-acetylase OafA/YrhL
MRLRQRRDDDALIEERAGTGDDVRMRRDADVGVSRTDDVRPRRDEVVGDEVIETTTRRWDVGSVLATAAGVALTVIGILALVRTGVDGTWYEPVEQIAGVQHTPLLGAIEVGVGVLLILAGLAGARTLAALVALAAGVAALIVAIEPSLVDDELAMERGWATLLAIAGLVLALVLIMARERREDRRIQRRSIRTA